MICLIWLEFDDSFELIGQYWTGYETASWKIVLTWREIFYYVSPYLVGSRRESSVKEVLRDAVCARKGFDASMADLEDQVFQTVAIQLKALGVVRVDISNSVGGIDNPLWSLTAEGEKFMVELRAIRKGAL